MPPRLRLLAGQAQTCIRCALRQSRQARKYHAIVPDRRIISLDGVDALPFLQGLVPANLAKIEQEAVHEGKLSRLSAIYTAFLNAQGRILNDVLIYPKLRLGHSGNAAETSYLIEVDSQSAKALFRHLKKHKLRSKFKMVLHDTNEVEVWSHWKNVGNSSSAGEELDFNTDGRVICADDPRPGLSERIILVGTASNVSSLRDHKLARPSRDYLAQRMLNGVAEGQSEIISESALPQESNIDFFGGIDFRKGCYLGQELTIRTHHTGVVRKRILPVTLSNIEATDVDGQASTSTEFTDENYLQPPANANISKLGGAGKGRSAGKWLGGVGDIGLALCRLEMLTDIQLTDTTTPYESTQKWKVSWEDPRGQEQALQLKARVPQWMRDKLTKPPPEDETLEDED